MRSGGGLTNIMETQRGEWMKGGKSGLRAKCEIAGNGGHGDGASRDSDD